MSPGIYVHREVGSGLLPKTEHEAKQTDNGAPRKHELILSHSAFDSNLTGLLARSCVEAQRTGPPRHMKAFAASLSGFRFDEEAVMKLTDRSTLEIPRGEERNCEGCAEAEAVIRGQGEA